MKREFNNLILKMAPKHRPALVAPNTESALFSFKGSSELVVWSGASEHTIWGDAAVNVAFRALHDALHLKTGLGFSPAEEIEMGRIQANMFKGLLADLMYIEVAGQAEHYMRTGQFVADQVAFTLKELSRV